MRYMGLDYGSKTVGVALSDELGLMAQAFETIERKHENKLRKTLARIENIVKEKDISLIVVGNPIYMDGREGIRVEKTKEFIELLKARVDIEIVLQDERLSTYTADEILKDSGVKKEDRKKYIDKVAAAIILQDYMNKVGQ